MRLTPCIGLFAVLCGCASSVSLDEDVAASSASRPRAYSAEQAAADPRPAWRPPVALAYSVRDGDVASPVATWNPAAEPAAGGETINRSYGQPGLSEQANYEFEQKLDDTWVMKQTLRYGRPQAQADADPWANTSLQPEQDLLAPGLGAFSVGSQAQAKLHALGMQHTIKFGFDYLTSRDIYEARMAPGPTLDIFDAGYGTVIGTPRLVARAYSEQRKTGLYAQDDLQWQGWTLSMVARQDQLSKRTIDLTSTEDSGEVQGSEMLSGRLGLRYRFDIGLEPYVNYSQTYAPGAGSGRASSQQYETGVKYQPAGLGQLMTLTAFNQVQSNTQTSDARLGCASAGCRAWAELRIQGATLESRLAPMEGLKLIASYALTNSSVTAASTDAYSTLLANRFPQVSEQRVALRARYAIKRGGFSGLSLDGRVGRTGAYYGSADQAGQAQTYTLMDAGINYDFGQLNAGLKGLKLRASANNLFDQQYWSYCYTDACALGGGRSVSAVLNYQIPWP